MCFGFRFPFFLRHVWVPSGRSDETDQSYFAPWEFDYLRAVECLKHIFRRRREPRYSSSLLVGYARLFLPPHRKLARLVRALLLLLHAFSFVVGGI